MRQVREVFSARRRLCGERTLLWAGASALAILTAFCASPASAQTWQGTVSDEWLNPANWSGGLPAGIQPVLIDQTAPHPSRLDGIVDIGTYAVVIGETQDGSLTVVDGAYLKGNVVVVGVSGTGSLTLDNGVVVANELSVGRANGSVGTVELKGPNAQLTSLWAFVGGGSTNPSYTGGRAELVVRDGAKLNTTGIGALGSSSTATAQALISGSGSKWDVGTYFIAGSGGGTGTLVIEDRAVMTTGGWASLGYLGSGSVGHATVRDAGSRWIVEGALFVGQEEKGRLEILAGGYGQFHSYAEIGAKAGSVGEIIVSGAGSIIALRDYLHVGSEGQGTLTITDGGFVGAATVTAASGTVIASQATSVGAVTVSGTDSALAAGSYLVIGDYGKANLLVEDGGVIVSSFGQGSDFSRIGRWAGSEGAATVTGPDSIWNIGNQLIIAEEGQGTLKVAEGGTVQVARIDIALASGSQGELIVGGSGAAAGEVRAGEIVFGAGTGRLTLDHSGEPLTGNPLTLAPNLSGAGTVDVRSGVTVLTGDSSGFAGTTNVHGGTLLVGDAAGNGVLGGHIVVKSGATLGGSGHIGINPLTTGNNSLVYNVIEAGGIMAPGNGGMGELTLSGGWRFEAGSQLHFQIGTPGSAETPGTSDRIVVGDGNRTHLVLSAKPELHLFDAGGAGIGHYRIISLNGAAVSLGQGGNFTIMQPGPLPGAEYRVALVMEPGGTYSHFDLIIGSPDNLQYWQDNSATWTAAGLDWRNSGGTVDVAWAGNHGVFDGNGGTIAVQGNQSFKGLQFVSSDYTLAGPGTLQTVAGGSELRVLGDETATISASITGAGGIFKTQGGTLVLSGANTYTGATLIEAGRITLTGAGSIAASESLQISGSGWLDASGVVAGTTSLGSLFSDGIISLGGTDLHVTQAVAGQADYITGTGDFTLSGPGVLTVTGVINMSRSTIEAGATLRVGDGTGGGRVMGNVHNVGTLIVDRTDTTFDDSVYTGNGEIFHRGSGTTILDADSRDYAGAFTVEHGTLRLTETAILGTSGLTVDTDGTLRGLGEVRGDVHIAGLLLPGAFTPATVPGGDNTLGALTVTGGVTFDAGATFGVRIAGDGSNDSLAVNGAATVAGNVEVTAIDAATSYMDGQTYTLLTATNGVTGTFNDPTMLTHSAFLTPTLTHNADDVVLTIAVTHDFTTVAETLNQREAASGLFGLDQTAGSDALEAFNTIANMNVDDARRAFDLSSGEIHATGQHVIDQTFALFNRALRYQGVAGVGAGNVGSETFTAPLGYGPAVARGNAGVVAIDGATDYADARVRGAWAAPLGGFGRINGNGNAAKLEWWNGGLAGGYEGVIDLGSGNAVGGLGFGYIRSHGSVDGRLSTFDSDGFYLGAYGAWADGPWNVAGSLSYGANSVSTERNIAFMGTTAEASYWTHTIGLTGEASYGFDVADTTRIAPLFTLDAGWSGHGGFTETGAGALNLTSGSESWTRVDAGIGLAVTHAIMTESGRITLEGRAVWEHAFADIVPSQALMLAGSTIGFTVHGPAADRNRLRLGAGLTWDVSDDMTLRARYDGLFSGDQANHSASLGLNIRF